MRLLAVHGKSQSGKSSLCNYIMGLEMQKLGIIDRFDVDETGKLLVNHDGFTDDSGVVFPAGMGPFDFERRDPEFLTYCAQVIWPHCRIFSFAESLKWLAVNMLRVEPRLVYGSDDDKNSFTQYSYADITAILPDRRATIHIKTPDKKLSGRQLLQYFGDVLRHLNNQCFIDVTMTQINESMTSLSLVSDCRRVDEIKRIRAGGGKVIHLTKKKTVPDNHNTERDTDGLKIAEHVDAVIDNAKMTQEEKQAEAFKLLQSWGWY